MDLFGNSGNSLFTKNRGVGAILNDDGVSAASSRLSSASAIDAAIADFTSVGPKKHGR